MTIPEEITEALKAVLFPELDKIKTEIAGVKGVISEQSQRLGDLNLHLIELERKIESTNTRIDGLRDELNQRIDGTNIRIDGTNDRLDRLYDVIVRRDEHDKLDIRVIQLEIRMQELSEKVAVLA